MKNIKFSWFQNGIGNTKPEGLISLDKFIKSTISPKEKLKEAFKEIADAGAKGDLKLKDKLKQSKLFFVTPSVIIDKRRAYDSIIDFTGLAVLEYDKIPHADLLRDYIFEKRKDCILAFLSPSKTGVKFLFKIPKPKTIDEYKEYYYGIAHDLNKFKGLDTSNVNCVLPLFISYDPDAKHREDAEAVGRRGFNVTSFDYAGDVEIDVSEYDENTEKEILSYIKYLFSRIESDGHIQVVKVCTMVGGFAANGHIDKDTALNALEECVINNNYLKKGTEGYLKTTRLMFNKGLRKPLKYETKAQRNTEQRR